MEMHRKQQCMAKKKTARGALSFNSPPPVKFRKSKSPFTPTKSGADIIGNIGATQADEDIERDSFASQSSRTTASDSFASQSSRTTARIRLQEKYVKVATLFKDEHSPEEIKERIREIAFNAMVKSTIYEDLDPADRAYGGFKKNNVLPAHI